MYVFFFFQAEDGIRDHCVTGVQTCALPISAAGSERAAGGAFGASPCEHARRPNAAIKHAVPRKGRSSDCNPGASLIIRSEERRVGKECRSRWSQDPVKENE